MILRSTSLIAVVSAVLFTASLAAGQAVTAPTPEPKVSDKKATAKPSPTPDLKAPAKPLTAEQVVDSSLYIYGFGGGRVTLNQIRKTTFERGKTTLIGPDGKIVAAIHSEVNMEAHADQALSALQSG